MKPENKNFLKEVARLKHIVITAQWQRNGVAKYKVAAYQPLVLECESETNEKKVSKLYKKLLTIKD